MLLAYGLPKATISAIRILYKKKEVKILLQDADRDYLDIAAGVLQGYTFGQYQFFICLDYVL